MIKKVCIVTASRAEYGVLRWIIDEVNSDVDLKLQLVVTGTHLLSDYGSTYIEIENDGYHIDERIEIELYSTPEGIVKSMGNYSICFADTFNRLKSDILVVLGDRYELLPICSAALMMNIPIAHVSGGDVTEGAIDDQIRNAITMMATLHFPGVKESADRIERMRGSSKNVFTVGEPGLDNFSRHTLLSRQELADNLELDSHYGWVLLTYHPETRLTLKENLSTVTNIISALNNIDDIQVIITGANSDYGGTQINNLLKKTVDINNSKYKFYNSLGQLRYLSLMNEVAFLIGNSSSAIIEAPYLGKPVINIGDRQKGRYMCKNVISSKADIRNIKKAINNIQFITGREIDFNYYGSGNTSGIILKKIKEYLL